MASFTLRNNGFIYLIHWVDRRNALRLSTKMKIDTDSWSKDKNRPNDTLATYNGYNIVSELNKYENSLTKALVNNPNSTTDELKRAVLTEVTPDLVQERVKITLTSYFRRFILETEARKQSNYKHYKACLNHLKDYSGRKEIAFADVDMKFYKAFHQHLLDKSLSMNTIANQFKLLKAVMQGAFLEGLHRNEAFRHFKRPMEQSDTIYLSEEELLEMYTVNLTDYLETARDYFIVGAFTGLRFEDWNRVSEEAIKDGVMSIRSSKTDEMSLIPVHPYVRAILAKYGGQLPRKFSNQKMNEYIKVVAMRAGIDEPVETRITRGGEKVVSVQPKCELVTTHTARRSLATNLILRGVSPFVVMKVTGHRSMSSFERYVRLQELQASIELKELEFFK